MQSLSEWLNQRFEADPRLNQTGLALSIGVGQSTVSKWLQGLSTPDTANCAKLAEFFGVPLARVLRIAGHINWPPRDTGDLIHHEEPDVTVLHIGDGGSPAYDPACHDRPGLARLVAQLEALTDDQLESLAAFMESMGK